MLARVFAAFQEVCAQHSADGADVLEVGAVATDDTLLCLPALNRAREKIGINLKPPSAFRDFKILQCNANKMDIFPDDRFDIVLCNATLEHDPYFWETIAEIKRVTKPGGLVVIGTPGYARLRGEGIKRPLQRGHRVPVIGRLITHPKLFWVRRGTVTVDVHNSPGDYYRFSEQAYRDVLFRGMDAVTVRRVMVPPIIVGSGRMPAAGPAA